MDSTKLFVLFVLIVTDSVVKGQEELLDECGCPDEWIRYNGSCYMFPQKALSFTDSEAFCVRSYSHLVHVDTAEENTFLKNYLSRMKDSNYWIGANDRLIEGIWNYVDTNDLITFTDWTPGQPDSWHSHNEDCALFYFPHNYLWDDGPCDSKILPICERRLPEANPIDVIG